LQKHRRYIERVDLVAERGRAGVVRSIVVLAVAELERLHRCAVAAEYRNSPHHFLSLCGHACVHVIVGGYVSDGCWTASWAMPRRWSGR
jgi:hypothetical protein